MSRAFKITLILCCLCLMPAMAYAQDPTPEPGTDTCEGCHEGLRDYWHTSDHGNAYSDPTFQAAWQEADNDPECLSCHTTAYDPATGEFAAEGVGCTTCHSPVPARHPDNYIPTNVSSRLCGDCHIDTFADWDTSMHSQEDLTCNQCHNPHTADIRVEDTQALCQTCHTDEAHYYAYTDHAEAGLLCVDCHLRVTDETVMGEGHGHRSHTFTVGMETCNGCHADDMHAPGDNKPDVALESRTACYRIDTHAAADDGARPAVVTPTPPSVGEPSLLLILGLGLIMGLVLYPVVEIANRRSQLGRVSK